MKKRIIAIICVLIFTIGLCIVVQAYPYQKHIEVQATTTSVRMTNLPVAKYYYYSLSPSNIVYIRYDGSYQGGLTPFITENGNYVLYRNGKYYEIWSNPETLWHEEVEYTLPEFPVIGGT